MARSMAGSWSESPPETLTKMSSWKNFTPSLFSMTAMSMDPRFLSTPKKIRLGLPIKGEGVTKAWISTRRGRAPSMAGRMATPVSWERSSDSQREKGFSTGISPCPVISKRPTSKDAPKRFLIARRIRP